MQWDAALKFIDSAWDGYTKDSDGKGWYYDNYSTGNPEHKTGISVDSAASNQVKNIYDMAGNVYEWTMESYYTDIRVYRGGGYDATGSNYPSSIRSSNNPSSGYNTVGFRITLFM